MKEKCKKYNLKVILICCLVLIVSVIAVVCFSTNKPKQYLSSDGRFSFNVGSDGKVRVDDYLGTENTLYLPTEIDGVEVSNFNDGILSKNDTVTTLVVQKGAEITEALLLNSNIENVTDYNYSYNFSVSRAVIMQQLHGPENIPLKLMLI